MGKIIQPARTRSSPCRSYPQPVKTPVEVRATVVRGASIGNLWMRKLKKRPTSQGKQALWSVSPDGQQTHREVFCSRPSPPHPTGSAPFKNTELVVPACSTLGFKILRKIGEEGEEEEDDRRQLDQKIRTLKYVGLKTLQQATCSYWKQPPNFQEYGQFWGTSVRLWKEKVLR